MTKLTVHDLRLAKGHRKLVMTTAFDTWTAKACEEAGLDIIVTVRPEPRTAQGDHGGGPRRAPNTMIGAGLPLIEAYSSDADALRLAGELTRNLGVDLVYASGMVVERFGVLARQRFPCVGHVGYLPVQDTWFGGPRVVGKSPGGGGAGVRHRPRDGARRGRRGGDGAPAPPARGRDHPPRRHPHVLDGQRARLRRPDRLRHRPAGHQHGYVPRHAKTYANLFDEASRAFARSVRT